MTTTPHRLEAKLAIGFYCLAMTIGLGCSERSEPKRHAESHSSEFRKIRFAGDWVVVPFRSGLPAANVPEVATGFFPKVGDRVVLSDVGDGEVFLAADLGALQFYHSSPGSDQLGRFRDLAETGKLFIVARGTTALVTKVVEGELPEGLRVLEIRLIGEKGGTAWVSETFARRWVENKK